MGVRVKCNECGNEYQRPYFSFKNKCPKCGSRDFLVINQPPRGVGCALLILGLCILFIVLINILTSFWPSRIGVTVLIIIGFAVIGAGLGIAFAKRK